MSRLDYAPKPKEIEITDLKAGLGVFTPKPDKPVSFAALKEALDNAGYTLDAATVTVVGVLERDERGSWSLRVEESGQRFELTGTSIEKLLTEAAPDLRVEIVGDWKTVGEGKDARETVSPLSVKKVVETKPAKAAVGAVFHHGKAAPSFIEAKFSLAPIRTTSPGLTVYRGGALAPRLFFIQQHLGNLSVSRQLLQLGFSYTPTPRLQLALDVPLARTAFADGTRHDEGEGLGNLTLWGKYRFYRRVERDGDRQAAVRFGLELPTGKKSVPGEARVNATEFVRQQLTPIHGGWSPHLDLTYSQARGRFIFGGNLEGVLRSERDGFRMGHEVQANTDLEYVLLPLRRRRPTKELFLILESTFVYRSDGRVRGARVAGSRSTEFYLAPGLQYVATAQFVIEGSVQLPVVRNTGTEVLKTDRNVLLGVKYLF